MNEEPTWSSEETLKKQQAEWRTGQLWECKPPGGNWHKLNTDYQPGWFYDTLYRRIS